MSEISKDIANFSRDPQESTEKNLQEQMLTALGSLVFKAYGSIVWRGEFNLGTSYQVNDFVSFQNSLYICTQENAGELLIEGFWDVMISSPSEVELRVFENNIEWKLESSIVWNHLIAIPSKLSDLEDDATHRLITDTERIKLDESYSWGNHAGIYSPLNHNHSNLYEPLGLALQLLSQHNSAFEHSLIASALQTETDPIFTASAAFSITALNISGWNEAHSWGDHAGLYSLLSHNHNTDYETIGSAAEALNTHNVAFDHSLISSALQSETDPVFTAWDKSTGISITESQISDFGSYIPTNEKGASLGVATLDAGGKVNLSQLPATLLIYKGVWSATTNTPTLLATDTTKKGWVYNVSVAGTQFGIDWKLGDWAIYNDNGVLEKSDNSDDVVSVNGYQGVVVLNKSDIGLGNVDNTSDLLKPISNATQSALDLKWSFDGNTLGSKKTIGSIDNQDFGIITNNLERLTILKNGNVGIGTASPDQKLQVEGNILADNIYAPSFENFRQTGTLTNKIITPDTTQIAQSPISPFLWHDIIAFTNPLFEVSSNGTDWIYGTVDKSLFSQKEHQSVTVLNSSSQKAVRWTWSSGMQWSQANWVIIGHTFTSGGVNKTILIESSSDGISWTQRHTSTYSHHEQPIWHYIPKIGIDNYLRITITHNSGGNVNLSSIRLLTSRWGNQGSGSERSFPYNWDEEKNMTFVNDVTLNKSSAILNFSSYSGTKQILTGGTSHLSLMPGGNVGIGTNSPGTKLDVDGEIKVKTLTISPDVSGRIFTMKDREGTIKSSFNAYTNGVQWSIAGSHPIWFRTDGALSYIMSGLGIGTTTPSQQLEITKNFRLPATVGTTPYGIIYKNGNRFIHDFNYGDNGTVTTTGNNTFVGLNAGNFTMGSTATAAYQASYNTGIGVSSLSSNTTGESNTANGYASLHSNTTGNQNTANGVNSLHSNTTGYQNTANGVYSLFSNTTGNQNTALGVNAGRYIADGTTGRSTGHYGLYLGYNSKASANGTNNEIVIGYNAIGKGSNTAIIGNESLKALYVSGQVIPATLTSNPTGIEGGIYFNTTDKHFYGYDGTTWKQLDN